MTICSSDTIYYTYRDVYFYPAYGVGITSVGWSLVSVYTHIKILASMINPETPGPSGPT